jgi:hypothetical protein
MVSHEANHLSLMMLDSFAFPQPIQENIQEKIGHYIEHVMRTCCKSFEDVLS